MRRAETPRVFAIGAAALRPASESQAPENQGGCGGTQDEWPNDMPIWPDR
jgi:hypothetical protein